MWWETQTSRWRESAHGTLSHRVCLTFRIVRVRDTVDNKLRLLAGYLFVVGLDVAQVVSTGIVRLPNTHRVVGEVDIAVIAEEFRHIGIPSLVISGRSVMCLVSIK